MTLGDVFRVWWLACRLVSGPGLRRVSRTVSINCTAVAGQRRRTPNRRCLPVETSARPTGADTPFMASALHQRPWGHMGSAPPWLPPTARQLVRPCLLQANCGSKGADRRGVRDRGFSRVRRPIGRPVCLSSLELYLRIKAAPAASHARASAPGHIPARADQLDQPLSTHSRTLPSKLGGRIQEVQRLNGDRCIQAAPRRDRGQSVPARG
jgi:hypothetical protein